jgi:hypothetical protein
MAHAYCPYCSAELDPPELEEIRDGQRECWHCSKIVDVAQDHYLYGLIEDMEARLSDLENQLERSKSMALIKMELTVGEDVKKMVKELIAALKGAAPTSAPSELEEGEEEPEEEDTSSGDDDGDDATAGSTLEGWDPAKEELKERYDKRLIQVMKDRLDEMGIKWYAKWSGKKLHETILDAVENGSKSEDKPKTPKKDGDKKDAGKKGKGAEKVRALLTKASRLVGKDTVLEVMEEVTGTIRLDSLNAKTGPALIKALEKLIADNEEGDGDGDW